VLQLRDAMKKDAAKDRLSTYLPKQLVFIVLLIKKENMIDIKHQRCNEEGCSKIPTFNLPTETVGLYCAAHKKENMINVTVKRCQHKNCSLAAIFGFKNQRSQFCESINC